LKLKFLHITATGDAGYEKMEIGVPSQKIVSMLEEKNPEKYDKEE